MDPAKESHLDKLALALSLGGVLLSAAFVVLVPLFSGDFALIALLVFVASQVAALVPGLLTRATLLGKTAVATSSVLLVLSVLAIA